MRLLAPLCLCVLCVLSVFTVPAFASEKVEIDNKYVRVLRVIEDPHEKSPMQDRPATVVVYLTDTRDKITDAAGKTKSVRKGRGDVAWFDAANTSEENEDNKPSEKIVIEFKPDAPRSPGWPVALDPIQLDPAHHKVLLENEKVRILRTTLDPHVKSDLHQHPSYVVVYLTDLHTTQAMEGKTIDNVRKAGEVAWRDALKHITLNVGEKKAVELQIELKK